MTPTPTLTLSEIVEQAARAILAYDAWRVSDANARKPPHDREKGEATNRFPGPTAADVLDEHAPDDPALWSELAVEANERAKELRET